MSVLEDLYDRNIAEYLDSACIYVADADSVASAYELVGGVESMAMPFVVLASVPYAMTC